MTGPVALEPIGRAPSRDVVLGTQGVPPGQPVPRRVEQLAEDAMRLYETLARPTGLITRISRAEFREVYEGEGRNAERSPLPEIVDRADHLAIFAATLGDEVSRKIPALFRDGDAALGSMLDGIASERANAAADLVARTFLGGLVAAGELDAEARVLPYSPGYCGWHVTGQRRLFAYADPSRIGIRLNESCLMSPIKSVSGVLVAGPVQAHAFDNDFDFCLDCADWECRDRIASLADPPRSHTEGSPEWRS